MQQCETNAGKEILAKRVSVRSAGAGHAQTGVVVRTPARRVGQPGAEHKPPKVNA